VQISAGYDLTYQCPQPTPMLLVLSVHPSRMPDVMGPHHPPPATPRAVACAAILLIWPSRYAAA
jgi:hypothetical protein